MNERVRAAVAELLGTAPDGIGDIVREPIDYDAFLAGRTVVRMRGTADVGGRTQAWSLIEKRTDGPATASAYLYDNGRREVAAYRSGLLDDLGEGLAAPRLLAAVEDPDGALSLWIEDVAPAGRRALSIEDVLTAARHLGRLAGRWHGRVPDDEWLFTGWVDRHRQPHAIADGMAVVVAARSDPGLNAAVGGRLDEALRMIASQDDYGSALARLVPTLCHHDAVAANVFPRDAGGERRTVLIDWESVGPGPVGADLASLVFASPRRGDFASGWLDDLLPGALAAYRDGLLDVGATVDPNAVALGLHASVALRWTLVRDVILGLRGTNRVFRGSAPHETEDRALAELVALVPVLLDSAAEARRLMAAR